MPRELFIFYCSFFIKPLPLKRKKRSAFSVVLWSIFFVTGLVIVFLFLSGYRYSSFSHAIHRLGFVDFSSYGSALFVDDVFVEKDALHDFLPLGSHSFCSKQFFYSTRCFHGEEVREHSLPRLSLEGVFLPLVKSDVIEVAKSPVFDVQGNAVAWFDNAEKNVFWLESSSPRVVVYPVLQDVQEVLWNNEEKNFEVSFVSGETELLSSFSLFSIPGFSFLQEHDSGFIISPLYIEKVQRKIKNSSIEVFFDIPAAKIIDIQGVDASLLVFPSSAYLFTGLDQQIRKVLHKDEDTPVLFFEETREFYWQQDGVLLKKVL